MSETMTVEEQRELLEQALFEIKRVIAGQDGMLERVLVCLLAGGHLLIEGVPGLAKTLTIKTTAGVLGGTFQRVQFTPDLVPSDLVGTRIYRPDSGAFDTELGPVFCNFLLADEINRAPAKVQSALLEVMQEHQVTIGHDDLPGARPVPRHGDPESDRVRGHVPAAGGPGRPLHAQGARRLPGARRGADRRPALARPAARPAADARVERAADLQRQVAAVYVDPALVSWSVTLADVTRGPATYGLAELRRVHRLRRQPARADQPGPGGSRARAHPRPRLRRRRGPEELAKDALRHRLVLSYRALAEEVHADLILDRCSPRCRCRRSTSGGASRHDRRALAARRDARRGPGPGRCPGASCARST